MQKTMVIAAVVMVVGMCFTGCEKRIDGSSDEAFLQSVTKIKDSLDSQKSKVFDTAFGSLVFSEFNVDEDKLRNMLNRKTAKQVVKIAKTTHQKVLAKLEKQEVQNNIARSNLKRIRLTNSRFRIERSGFIDRPIISFNIENTTAHTISWFSFSATLKSKNRKVPWAKDSYAYTLKGGLNPTETQQLTCEPNMFGEFSNLEDRNDYQLELELLGIKDENGKLLWEVDDTVSEQIAQEKQMLELFQAW